MLITLLKHFRKVRTIPNVSDFIVHGNGDITFHIKDEPLYVDYTILKDDTYDFVAAEEEE